MFVSFEFPINTNVIEFPGIEPDCGIESPLGDYAPTGGSGFPSVEGSFNSGWSVVSIFLVAISSFHLLIVLFSGLLQSEVNESSGNGPGVIDSSFVASFGSGSLFNREESETIVGGSVCSESFGSDSPNPRSVCSGCSKSSESRSRDTLINVESASTREYGTNNGF